jgi:uncharacterized RDD family membrane protein YckC
MTQQNETEHQPAGAEHTTPPAPQPAQTPQQAPSGVVYPSPYLDGGEGMPQAYLAPPQPGQPRYGSPGQGARPFGGSQPRYAQPPTGGPAPRTAPATRRDPALATPWHRLAAATLDWLIIIPVSIILFWSPLSQISRELQAIAAHYPGLASPAAQAAVDGVFRNPATLRSLLFWLFTMFGIALVYYWAQHAAWGATLGKRALGMRVVKAADRSRIGVRQAGIRAVAYLAGPAILMLPLTPIGIVGGVLWLADAGVALVDARTQSLHDKLAGTVVVRQSSLRQRSRGSQPW